MRALALLLLMPLVALGQTYDGGEIVVHGYAQTDEDPVDLDGPDVGNVGREVALTILNTPIVDLSQSLVEQLDWLMDEEDRMLCYLFAPGEPYEPLNVHGEMVFGIDGIQMLPRVRFTPERDGEHRVVIAWHKGKNRVIEHIVRVGQGDDDPDPPTPDPDPPSPPQGELVAVVVRESGLMTPDLALTLNALRRHWTSSERTFRILDPDSETVDNWGETVKQMSVQVGLPALMETVLQEDGSLSVVGGYSLPDNTQDAMKLWQEVEDKYGSG